MASYSRRCIVTRTRWQLQLWGQKILGQPKDRLSCGLQRASDTEPKGHLVAAGYSLLLLLNPKTYRFLSFVLLTRIQQHSDQSIYVRFICLLGNGNVREQGHKCKRGCSVTPSLKAGNSVPLSPP